MSDKGPLISCIIAVYNSERFVAAAVDSVLAQSYRPIEVIVANDGSTDRTAKIVAGYGKEVRLATQETAGPAATRNLGLATASGEYVAFLDGDDLWHEEKLERQMACLTSEPELGACVTNVKFFWMPELAEEEAKLKKQPRGQVAPGYISGTLLAPRSTFEKVGGFDIKLWFSDAADWFERAAESGVTIKLLDDVLYFHRMHDRNLTRRRAEDSRNEFLAIVQARLKRQRQKDDAAQANTSTGTGDPDKDQG